MENINAYSYLKLEKRHILKGISYGSTKTTISQEIKAHRVLVKKSPPAARMLRL